MGEQLLLLDGGRHSRIVQIFVVQGGLTIRVCWNGPLVVILLTHSSPGLVVMAGRVARMLERLITLLCLLRL